MCGLQLWRQPSISSSNKLESCRNIYRYPVSVTVHNLEAVTALRFLYCVLDSMLLFWFLSQHRRETLSRVSRKRQSTMLFFDIQEEDLLLILKTIDSMKLMIFANTDQHCLQS